MVIGKMMNGKYHVEYDNGERRWGSTCSEQSAQGWALCCGLAGVNPAIQQHTRHSKAKAMLWPSASFGFAGDREDVVTENLAPDDPPVEFGQEAIPLQVWCQLGSVVDTVSCASATG